MVGNSDYTVEWYSTLQIFCLSVGCEVKIIDWSPKKYDPTSIYLCHSSFERTRVPNNFSQRFKNHMTIAPLDGHFDNTSFTLSLGFQAQLYHPLLSNLFSNLSGKRTYIRGEPNLLSCWPLEIYNQVVGMSPRSNVGFVYFLVL